MLILTNDPDKATRLERRLECTREAAIDEMLETTDWASDPVVAPFLGGKGTPHERLEALRTAWGIENGELYSDDEEEMAMVARETQAAIDEGRPVSELTRRIFDKAVALRDAEEIANRRKYGQNGPGKKPQQ